MNVKSALRHVDTDFGFGGFDCHALSLIRWGGQKVNQMRKSHTPVTILRQLRNIGELGSGQSQRRARV